MSRHRIRTCRPWWMTPTFFAYLAATAFILGAGIVKFAPELARSLVEYFK